MGAAVGMDRRRAYVHLCNVGFRTCEMQASLLQLFPSDVFLQLLEVRCEELDVFLVQDHTLLLRQVPQVGGGGVAESHGILHTHVFPCLEKPSERKLNRTASMKQVGQRLLKDGGLNAVASHLMYSSWLAFSVHRKAT